MYGITPSTAKSLTAKECKTNNILYFISVAACAKYFGKCKQTIRRYCRNGKELNGFVITLHSTNGYNITKERNEVNT